MGNQANIKSSGGSFWGTPNVNPINEVQILEGHNDIVRFLTKVSDTM